jgi:hypothetical protein
MRKLFKIIIILLIVAIGAGGVWLSLDNTTKCYLIYGKNICNFYAMMYMEVSLENFDRMMELCRDMHDVPKKDSCFEVVAQSFARIDIDKAREACDEIKEIMDNVGNIVHKKEDCYSRIEEAK